MNCNNWKEYKLSEIVDIKSSNGYIDINKATRDDNGVNFVLRTTQNNGVEKYKISKEGLENKINKGNCLSLGMHGLTAFYQEKEFIACQNILIIRYPELNKMNSLFLATVINFSLKGKFSYGRVATMQRLKDLIIKLPTKDDKPDWEYMEQYMKSLEEKINIPKIKKHNIPLNVEQWEEYKIGDLFFVSRGERITKEQYKQVKDEEFKYPVVTATTVNNGVSGYYTKTNCPANTLTCAGEASGMHTFYQSKDTWVVDSSRMFIPKENTVMNRWIGLFLIPIFNIHKNRFSYGRKANPETIEKLIIKLPTKDGQPDWDFMENYMKAFIAE